MDNLAGAYGEAFEKAVIAATERATQNVAQVHRRRLVTHSAVITAIVTAIIGIVVIVSVTASNNSAIKNNSKFNCNLFTRVSEDMEQFVQTDANLRRMQQLDQKKIALLRAGALKQLLEDPQTVSLSEKSAKIDKETTHFWITFLVPDLQHLANINCERSLH